MLIHIFDDTPHHYNPMIKFFSEQCSVSSTQQFWLKKPKSEKKLNFNSSVISQTYVSSDELLKNLTSLPKNAKIIFHGLMDLHIWRKVLLSSVASRCSCVMWGAELYRHGAPERGLKHYIAQLIHMLLVKRFNKVLALNPGDATLVSQYLKRSDVNVLPYPLIGTSEPDTLKAEYVSNIDLPLKILVGNSAAESNHHLYALEQLAHLAEHNVEIIMPLNYAGSERYISEVILEGQKIFNDKFKPITNMLTKSEYDDLLINTSLSVFAHQRQQGLYVAYSMLLMGKPLFLREHTSSFKNFKSLDFTVYGTESLTDYSFSQLTDLVKNKNKHNSTLMDLHFTEEALAPKWSEFLNGLLVK